MAVPKIVITAGLMLANMALSMTRKIEGPRLDDLKFTDGDYGTPLAMVWGTRRMQVPIFWAEDLTEVKRRRKTKGGKFNEYTYFGTWAVALAGHEIDAVRRIWFDTHLVYDVSGTGPVAPFDFGANSGTIDDYFAFYLGTESQDPDPRIQATEGEANTPAYRGTAYAVFKDIPLEKLGNRIPQVSVEIVNNATATYPSESLTLGDNFNRPKFSSDYAMLAFADNNSYGVVDVAARAIMLSGVNQDIVINSTSDCIGFTMDGNLYYGSGANDAIAHAIGGSAVQLFSMSSGAYGSGFSVVDGDGNDVLMFRAAGYFFDASGTQILSPRPGGMLLVDTDGDPWLVGKQDFNSTDTVIFANLYTNTTISVTFGSASSGQPLAFHYKDATNDHFILAWDGVLYMIDRADGTNLGNYTPADPSALALKSFNAIIPGATTFWCGFEEISSADLSQARALDARDWGRSTANPISIYDPINHALISGTGPIHWNYLDRIGSSTVTLQSIANDIADDCAVEDYDFSDLDQAITGWSATRGPAAAILEPLLDTYDSDIRPHDFTIEGLKRTGVASGSTLATAKFVGEPRYTVRVRQAAELPRALLVDFADTAAEQQVNTARADRPLDTSDARGEKKIDLSTLALGVDEAIQLATRYFRRIWNERKQPELALTAQNLGLEPADVRTLELDGETITARCVRSVIRADDVIETEWRYDAPTLATLDGSTGAEFLGRDDSSIAVPLLSKGFVLDVPYIEDSDDQSAPLVYLLAAPYTDGAWPGAVFYQETGGEYTDELGSIASSAQATWGYVEEELAYANPNLWDRGTELTVNLQVGTLAGITEAQADADPTRNLVAIGANGRWELVQFTNATLVTGNQYTISGFKRGRRGTEWAAELHEAGDAFVLLDMASPETLGLSEVGTDLSFKAVTAGRTTAGAFDIDLAFTGASLKPYAPTALNATKESNGDWTIDAIRRTRVGGAWTSNTTIPLSEDSESYSITLSDGVTTVTKTASSLPYTWTQAAQISDMGSEVTVGNLDYTVAQVSADVGAGYAAEASA